MCEICIDKKQAFQGCQHIARNLRTLANDYDNIVRERIKPHTEGYKIVNMRATNLIRILVDNHL
jgi:hypothetical protein